MKQATFFATPAAFRRWLAKNHAKATELWVGFHKKGTGKPSITWPESVDESLCYGWIDGLRQSIDEDAYRIRFTPRKPTSIWSKVNIARVAALEAEGRMTVAGRAAFARRSEEKSAVYAYEREHATLTKEMQARFEKNEKAWSFFSSQPPSYRRVALYWVTSAKKEETRARRFAQLLTDSASGRRIAQLTPPGRGT
ncbi:MAG: YdeI/OmpD-associated family protein [Labilithrix sp.]|nr:YdeI/OmpD-associated family protein [Labilithrix sp.]MCW5810792.1 YdeI/OmpD-associated family protein [Labilithrix sp.]